MLFSRPPCTLSAGHQVGYTVCQGVPLLPDCGGLYCFPSSNLRLLILLHLEILLRGILHPSTICSPLCPLERAAASSLKIFYKRRLLLLKDSFDRYLARWGSADRMREYNGQMGLWVSKVQSTLTAAVVL